MPLMTLQEAVFQTLKGGLLLHN